MSSRTGICLICEYHTVIRQNQCSNCGGPVVPDFPRPTRLSRFLSRLVDWLMARR